MQPRLPNAYFIRVKMLRVKWKTFFLSTKCINFLKQSVHWALKKTYVYNLLLAKLLLMAFCTTIFTVHKISTYKRESRSEGRLAAQNPQNTGSKGTMRISLLIPTTIHLVPASFQPKPGAPIPVLCAHNRLFHPVQ